MASNRSRTYWILSQYHGNGVWWPIGIYRLQSEATASRDFAEANPDPDRPDATYCVTDTVLPILEDELEDKEI